MIDYSFIRLKGSLVEAMNIGDSPIATHNYCDMIQLSPNESYLQITNYNGGVSLAGDYQIKIVDCNDLELSDVTENVFIEEFTDANGYTQLAIEIVNLGIDYNTKPVFFKFIHTTFTDIYYSNPVNITESDIELSTYFQYKNYCDFQGIGYTNAQKWQSIRLRTYFDIPIDESEAQDYYQISRQTTISARMLIKKFERYQLNYINRFTYERLNILLKHELIYVDGVKMTNKTTIESGDRFETSNVFSSNFTIAKNYADILDYNHQIFNGFLLIDKIPEGSYTLAGLPTTLKATFNTDITLNSGTLTIYDSSDSVVDSFTEVDMSLSGTNAFTIDITGVITLNDTYYVQFDSGLISSVLEIDHQGISNKTDWQFIVGAADYLATDYDNSDYFAT